MSRHAVVLLAYHYPPMLGPASARAASFARHLPASGWDPTVVSVRAGLYHRQDAPDRLPDVPTIRTRSPEPARLVEGLRRRASSKPKGRAAVEEVAEADGGPVAERLRRLLRDYAYIPDGQVGWIPFAIAGLRRAIRDLPAPAVLFSTSVPYSAHLACLRVATDEGIPWVAELRDPWALIEEKIRPRSRARKRIDATLERRVVSSASAVVVTTKLTREAMAEVYPELSERFWVVRNGFEPTSADADPPGREQPLQLVQAGSVPDGTALEPLLRGIGRVARAHPGEVRLRVLAPRELWMRSAAAVGSPGWLELAGLVSPQEAAEAIRRASVNVLLRPGPEHRQYVAAKLTEYLGARRPILAIVDPAGEMASLGRRYGDVRLIAPYDEATVATAVEELLARHRQGALAESSSSPGDLSDLTRAAQAARLAQVLESAIEPAGGASGR